MKLQCLCCLFILGLVLSVLPGCRSGTEVPEPAATPEPEAVEAAATQEPEAVAVKGAATPAPEAAPQQDSPSNEDPGPSGAPDQMVIRAIVDGNQGIKQCISAQRTLDPDLSGKIYLKFKILPSGEVLGARLSTPKYVGTDLDSCISREANALRFSPFEGRPQSITYPLPTSAQQP